MLPEQNNDQQVEEVKAQESKVEDQKVETKELSPEELKAELDKYRGLTDKFKVEAEKYRKKNSELRTKEDEAEKKRLEEKGMYKEMYLKEKEKTDNFLNAAQKGSRVSAVKESLLKQGCNPKYVDLMVERVSLQEIELDDQLSANEEQVAFQTSKLKNTYIDLFKKDVTIKDGTPTETRNLSYREELKTCKSQADLDRVMRKHGRI